MAQNPDCRAAEGEAALAISEALPYWIKRAQEADGGRKMCEHGNQVAIIITQQIQVDRCIAEEIQWLNAQGVRTEGCCCGHGREAASAIIQPSSVKRATELGYEPEICGPTHKWEIKLKHAEGAGK